MITVYVCLLKDCTSGFFDPGMEGEDGKIIVVNSQKALGGLPRDTSSPRLGERITLLVDEKRFVVDPEMFRQHPNTMLGRYVTLFTFFLLNVNNELC